MNYVDSLNLFGVEARQTSCIKINGVPTATTKGAVGVLAMDIDSENKEVYKCIAQNEDGTYEWELFSNDIQPDWKQNDETKLDYIKNKTHYHIPGYTVIDTYGTADEWEKGWCTGFIQKYEIGVEYECLINNEIKSTVIFDRPLEEYPTIYLTENCHFSVFDHITGMVDFGGSDIYGKDFSVKVYKPDILVQLDEKYIPDTIARKSDIAAGTSVQSDWEQNDETAADYIKNRPFYIGSPSCDFYWDGFMFEHDKILPSIGLEHGKEYYFDITTYDSSEGGPRIATKQSDETILLSFDPWVTIIDNKFTNQTIIKTASVKGIRLLKPAEDFVQIPDEYLPSYVFNKNKIVTWNEIQDKPVLLETNNDGSTVLGNSLQNPNEGFSSEENTFSAGYGCSPKAENSQAFGYYTSIGIKGYVLTSLYQDNTFIELGCNSLDHDTSIATSITNGIKIYVLTYQENKWQLIEIGHVLDLWEADQHYIEIAPIENCPALIDTTITPIFFLETPYKTELQPGCLGDVMAQGPDVIALTPEQISDLSAQGVKVTYGARSHVEGHFSQAIGNYAHAQNNRARAIGNSSDAGGQETWARGGASMTRGGYTETMPSALFSFARGRNTKCHGIATEASGYYNEAFADYSTVRGKYSLLDTDKKYLDIVGNGTSESKRKNIYTLSKEGVLWVPKAMKIGGVSETDSAASQVATLKDLEKISIPENILTKEDLKDYATKSELSNYATTSELNNYTTKSELSNYATKSDIDAIMLEIIETQKQIAGGEL